MLEQMILETKDRHSKQPISPEQYHKWRNSKVTKRLFEDLELAVIDSFQDYLPEDSNDQALTTAMVRQGEMKMVDMVLDWSPAGVEGPNDED